MCSSGELRLSHGSFPESLHVPDLFQNSRRSVPGLSGDEKIKRDFDKIVTDEAIRYLNEQLNESTFKSSTRILILVLLAQARRISSVELRTLTGLGKGSLENHLNKLESFDLVRISNAKSIGARGSPMRMVEITEKGLNACRGLVKSISSLTL
jgi:DNA-binding MarR family transcriptional regulator